MGSGYDDILSVQLSRNKTSSIGRESREGRYVRGGRMVSDFTCPSEIRCFYPIRSGESRKHVTKIMGPCIYRIGPEIGLFLPFNDFFLYKNDV